MRNLHSQAKTLLCTLLVLVQMSSAFAGTIRIQGNMNARDSGSFLGRANVKAVFPKGTIGEILERRELPSGNYGIKLKITTLGGPSRNLHVGDEAWVYFHRDPERRLVELYDDQDTKVEDPTQGVWALAVQSFRAPVPASVQKSAEICESCSQVTPSQLEAKPIQENQTAAMASLTEFVQEENFSGPELNIGYEEILTYINSVNPKQKTTNEKIAKTVLDACTNEKVPVEYVLGIMRTESDSFNPKARSYADARGLMQIMSGTWKGLGGGQTSRYDIDKNIRLGVKYLAQLLKSYKGDQRLAAAAYNWGPGNVAKHLRGEKQMTRVARNYVSKVMKYQQNYIDFEMSSQTTLAQN